MAEYESVPFAQRTIDDVIVRNDEHFRRGEIDRSIDEPDLLFSTIPLPSEALTIGPVGFHPENTPSYVATETVKATGHVAIADIGCGTANTLMTWGRRVSRDAGRRLGRVGMTGISRQDYTQESRSSETIGACKGSPPIIQYLVGDAEHMPEILSESQDVTLAYNSLVYARRPDEWLAEMVRITKPGGTLFFNATFSQAMEGQPLPTMLDTLRDNGLSVLNNNLIMGGRNVQKQATSRRIMRTTTLYRVDIPQV